MSLTSLIKIFNVVIDSCAAQYHVIPLSLLLSPSNTALTVDNVVRQLKDITWNTLCSVLLLPHSQRRKIKNEYATENQHRNAAVHFWLFSDPYASWRRLIARLDFNGQHAVVGRIRDYAEKLTADDSVSGFINDTSCLQLWVELGGCGTSSFFM